MTSALKDEYRLQKQRELIRNRRRAAGLPIRVPTAPLRKHLESLLAIGMTVSMVAENCGASKHFILDVKHHKYEVARYGPAERLMQANHLPAPQMTMVLAVGASRRIRALAAIGWSGYYLAERVGTNQRMISKMHDVTYCTFKQWQQYADLYDELSMKVGPWQKAKDYAANHEWRNPMEWEGYDIDDPRIEAPLARRLSQQFLQQERAEMRAEILRLQGDGWTPPMIARRLQISERQVYRIKSYRR